MAWLFAPTDRRALGDVAKLAAALRGGTIPASLLDGSGDVALGEVGRVVLLGAGDLGLAATPANADRRFVLARGTVSFCLAEVVEGDADGAAASRLLEAAAALGAREPSRRVVPWLLARRIDSVASALLREAGALATTIA